MCSKLLNRRDPGLGVFRGRPWRLRVGHIHPTLAFAAVDCPPRRRLLAMLRRNGCCAARRAFRLICRNVDNEMPVRRASHESVMVRRPSMDHEMLMR